MPQERLQDNFLELLLFFRVFSGTVNTMFIMKIKRDNIFTLIFAGIAFFFIFPMPAHTYVDAGTGSYIFQLMIAGLLGGVFFVKSAFRKMKDNFKNPSLKKEKEVDENT